MEELGRYIDPFTDCLFYATFPIQEQSQKGNDWNYRLSEVYTVGIMDRGGGPLCV